MPRTRLLLVLVSNSLMTSRLNHPLKRLSFILFLCSVAILAGLALLPVEINTRSEWKDAAAADKPTRHVTRIDTACAAVQSGTKKEEFARDFFIVDAFSSDNELTRMITEIKIVRDEPFTIGPMVDLLEEERMAFFAALSGGKKPCLEGVCVAKLNTELLTSILKACSTSVGQFRKSTHEVRWPIAKNLIDTFPWSLSAFLLSVFFLLCSLLYDRTLGALIKWVRTGSW